MTKVYIGDEKLFKQAFPGGKKEAIKYSHPPSSPHTDWKGKKVKVDNTDQFKKDNNNVV